MTIQPPKIIPLYVPETQEAYENGSVTVSTEPAEGLVLLTSENEVRLLGRGLDGIGHLEIIVYDTPQQARDARVAIDEYSKHDVETRNLTAGTLPSGEGVLIIQNPNHGAFMFDTVDRRAPSEEHPDQLSLSADLDAGQFARMKEEIENTPSNILHARKTSALGTQIEEMGLTVVMQTELERRKGGYIAMELMSPEGVLQEKSMTIGGVFKEATVDDVREAMLQALDHDDISSDSLFEAALMVRLQNILHTKAAAPGGPTI